MAALSHLGRFASWAGLAAACLALSVSGSFAQVNARPPEAKNWPVVEAPRPGWKRIQLGNAFSFEAPIDTQHVALQGIDSAVGGYETDRFSFMFDYGRWSNSLSDATPWSDIDGYRSRLESGSGSCRSLPTDREDRPFGAAVYVELRPRPNRLALSMFGCATSEAGLEELRQIYLSLRFNPQPPER